MEATRDQSRRRRTGRTRTTRGLSVRVLMVGAEMAPYSKTGGLGEVLGALPLALAARGCEVGVVIPYLPSMDPVRWGIAPAGAEVEVWIEGRRRVARLLQASGPAGVKVIFLDCPAYFHRPGLYGTPQGDYPDNPQRFAFLCYGALEAAKRLFPLPDVIHAHDWQAALVPFLLRATEHYGLDATLRARTVMTVHNLSYQGVFPKDVLPAVGISWSHFRMQELEFYDRVNFLKAGLVSADAITTVSPAYADEITTRRYGWGLDGVLRERRASLVGILNGIDPQGWNPGADPRIPAPFTVRTLCRRAENRDVIRQTMALRDGSEPVVAMVTRLAQQKGIDLLLGLRDRIPELGVQWAILGSGDHPYETAVLDLARRYPGTVGVRIGFDDETARLLYAGSDFFCMPSLFEPCGLGQLIALRYGSIPIVRRTGGLADTVRDLSKPDGVGIVFDEPTAEALAESLGRARDLAGRTDELLEVRRRAMACDFSWRASAGKY
ncbi:MAG: glycogen synthase GlgA, partial [Deltaproteobacteria bacterium]|nr:glycogen synthase GlgA [Deltaproteobacteria bacterium]